MPTPKVEAVKNVELPPLAQSAVSEEEVLFQADPASSPPSPSGAPSGGSRKGSPEKRKSTIL